MSFLGLYYTQKELDAAVKKATAPVQTKLDAANKAITSLQARLVTVSGSTVSDLKTKLDAANTKITDLQTAGTALQNQLEKANSDLAAANKKVTDQNVTNAKLQSTNTTLTKEIAMIQNTAKVLDPKVEGLPEKKK